MKYEKPGDRERHLNAVRRGSAATYGSWAVLEALCRLSDFKAPTVTTTKPQLCEESRRSRTIVKQSLVFLRSEGTLVPVRNWQGGRGNAVTYELRALAIRPDAAPVSTAPALWEAILDALRPSKAAAVKTWLEPLEAQHDGGELTLAAPTAFAAKYVRENLADAVLRAGQGIDPTLERVSIQ